MHRKVVLRNIAAMLLSMALTVLMCCLTTPTDTTISAMQARQPVLGVLWPWRYSGIWIICASAVA